MERLAESLRSTQQRLSGAGIESAAIGGLAVAIWGEPRVTRDVDLKILLERSDGASLLEFLQDGGYKFEADASTVRNASGTRVDFLLADTSFDRACVQRRVPGILPGKVEVEVCTAEDLIVLKLISTRPRDREDAAGVVLRQKGKLDQAYVEGWLREFEDALDDSTLVAEFRALLGQ